LGHEIGRVAGLMERFQPDLVLTDYEFFSQWAARRIGLPCVSLDNQHLLTLCRVEPPPGRRISRLVTLALIRLFYSSASHYLVTSFHASVPKDSRKTEVFPPVLRPETEKYRPSSGEHGVIYLRGGLPEGSANALALMDRPYIVYGLGRRPPEANLKFKPFSDAEFLSDLAASTYLICNGGHTAVSEALHYGKPVLCRPIDFFYEQEVNGFLLSKTGYGDRVTGPGDWGGALVRFEKGLDGYADRIRGRMFRGNDRIAARIEEFIRGAGKSVCR
jgi:uncharacterized protein (TIGR00661 family)